jgi:carboxymethylenebutenolidase
MSWQKQATSRSYLTFCPAWEPKGGGSSEFAPGAAPQAVGNLPPQQMVADLDTVAGYARKIPAANGNVALAGFGWGASEALVYARGSLGAIYRFPESSSVRASGTFSIVVPISKFAGPDNFMRDGDAPGATGPAKEARDEAWERWKKLLTTL